jgi:hypothetical protein
MTDIELFDSRHARTEVTFTVSLPDGKLGTDDAPIRRSFRTPWSSRRPWFRMRRRVQHQDQATCLDPRLRPRTALEDAGRWAMVAQRLKEFVASMEDAETWRDIRGIRPTSAPAPTKTPPAQLKREIEAVVGRRSSRQGRT